MILNTTEVFWAFKTLSLMEILMSNDPGLQLNILPGRVVIKTGFQASPAGRPHHTKHVLLYYATCIFKHVSQAYIT